MAAKRALTATGVLTFAFLAQLAGHLLLKYYMPNPAVGGVGFLLVGLIFSYVLLYRQDVFGFVLVVYICSHFSYADNQGGLWNLMAFGIGAAYLAFVRWKGELRRPDSLMATLLAVFVLWNVAGWVARNPMPLVPLMQGAAAFLGFIVVFRLVSATEITPERLRLFLTVIFFMLIYQFLVALNQRYGLINLNTPLLGSYSELGSALTRAAVSTPGTLTNFELFGEYNLLMICLLVPLLSSSLAEKELRFGNNRIMLMIFLSLSCIVLSRNRSSAILVILAVVMFYVFLPLKPFASVDRFGRQIKLILALAILTPLAATLIGLQSIEEKFSELGDTEFSIESVVSGKSINRGGLVRMGMSRIKSDSWLVGHGYGIPRSNRWAWFGSDPKRRGIATADFHSLYLSLPMLFGWVGSFAFLAMIVVTWFRSVGATLRYRNRKSYLFVVTIGLSMMWFVFLANEYKIGILRNPNYTMLFWILLGFSMAVLRTIRIKHSVAVKSPSHPPAVVPGRTA